ncbi:MAG: hypothetical protein JWM11_3276 [Planctomycetaceae bacterium]|nr:hypothetical protein [Planctomycetaceae bacterium]
MPTIRSNRVRQIAAVASALGLALAVLPSSIGFAQSTTEKPASQADKADPKAKTNTDGIQIEFRWAESAAKEGLTESEGVDLSETKGKVFIHKKPILTNQDIATANAVKNKSASSDLYYIDVYLTKDAAKRMAKSSEENLKKSLVVLADGKIISALTPMQPLSDWVLIYGPFAKAEAERFATSIKTKTAATRGGEPESAVQTEDKHWQDLDVRQRGIKDRIVTFLTKTPALSDQQVALAVYLLTVGRPPTDAEVEQAQKKFADTKDRPLGTLQVTRNLVQGKDFNTAVAATNDRLFKIQKDLATKREAGEIPILMSADEAQRIFADCAAAVNEAAKTDQQFVDLAYLLALSRFPTATESKQSFAHLKQASDRATATTDIFKFLLNSREFLMPK